MTITTGNALPIAAISMDISADTQLSDSLQMLADGTALLDGEPLPQGFQTLLDQQMNKQDLSSSFDPAVAEAAPDDALESGLLASLDLAQSASGKDVAPIAVDQNVAQAAVDQEALDDAEPEYAWSPVVAAATDTPEAQLDKTLSDNGEREAPQSSSDDDDAVAVVAIAPTGAAPDQSLGRSDGGESLPPARQSGAPSPIDVIAANAQTFPASGEVRARTDKAASTVNDDAKVLAASDDETGKDFEQALNESGSPKTSLDRPHREAMKLSSKMAHQAAGQAQPVQSGVDISDAGLVRGDIHIHAAPQPSTTVSSIPVQPALHSLQLSPQASPLQWGDALGEKVSMLINHKLDKAEIRIDPPHLGKLDIQIQLKDDSASIHIQTHHAATRDLIDAASFRLKDFLHNSGYSAVDVNVSHREQSMGQGASNGQQSTADTSEISEQASAILPEAHSSVQNLHAWYSGQGMVDYFA